MLGKVVIKKRNVDLRENCQNELCKRTTVSLRLSEIALPLGEAESYESLLQGLPSLLHEEEGTEKQIVSMPYLLWYLMTYWKISE